MLSEQRRLISLATFDVFDEIYFFMDQIYGSNVWRKRLCNRLLTLMDVLVSRSHE